MCIACRTIERIAAGYQSASRNYSRTTGQKSEAASADKHETRSNPHQSGDNEGKLVGYPVAESSCSGRVVGRIYRINPDSAYRETFQNNISMQFRLKAAL